MILRTVIGASDPARLAALRAVMPKLLSVGQWASLAIARPELQRRRPWRGLWRRIEEADRLLYAEIAERRADPHLDERTDVLAMLVRAADEDGRTMTDRELRDQLMTLLVAGPRHHRDGAVVGAGTADPSPCGAGQGAARGRCGGCGRR